GENRMLTFFNDPQLKAALLARLEGHRLADEIASRSNRPIGPGLGKDPGSSSFRSVVAMAMCYSV
ncbi:MAG: hypothetical protein ACE1Y4_10845, partial [Lysobacterales bacterium]